MGSRIALAEDAEDGATEEAPAEGAPAGEASAEEAPAEDEADEIWPSAPPFQPTASSPPTAPSPPSAKFSVDPVGDTAVIAVSTGFAGLLDLIITTGEVRPPQISPSFDVNQLLAIDRGAVTQHIDPNAETYSNIGIGVALGYAIIDPIATGFRERNTMTGLIDGVLYLETFAVTIAATNIAKVAVRRPRPLAYTEAQAHRDDPTYSNTDTDSSLSFFSGHASVTAALTATATYLAFARSPKTARPWITLAFGTALTAFVGFERVRAGKHFPTDVIAGAIAGTGVGLLVPHVHRADQSGQRPYWFGATPLNHGKTVGGMVSFGGNF